MVLKIIFVEPTEKEEHNLGVEFLYSAVKENCKNVLVDVGFISKNNTILRGYFSKLPIEKFDAIGFSLSNPIFFLSFLKTLRKLKIPLLSKKRKKKPLIFVGGQGAMNPEPLANFVDFFVMGEAEEICIDIVNTINIIGIKADKKILLKKIMNIRGVYAPSFYKIFYRNNNEIKKISPLYRAPKKIKIQILKDVNKFRCSSSISLENRLARIIIDRGCKYKCKFCEYSHIKKYYRFVKFENIKKEIDELCKDKLNKKIGLISALSATHHPNFHQILSYLKAKKIKPHFFSFRADTTDCKLFEEISKIEEEDFCFAPESSERMRFLINKKIKDEEILETINLALKKGVRRFRMFLMLGLPGEKEKDIEDLALLINKIKEMVTERNGFIFINVSLFFPSPFTPLEREKQEDLFVFSNKFDKLKRRIITTKRMKDPKTFQYFKDITKNVEIEAISPFSIIYEGIFYRGDRRLTNALLELADSEENLVDIVRVFKKFNLDIDFYFNKINRNRILPWSHIVL